MNPALIHQLTARIAAVREVLGEHDADEGLREDMIEGETDADEILSKLARHIRFADAMASGAKEAKKATAQKLDARIERFEREGEACRDMARMILEAEGIKKRILPEATISLSAPRKSLVLDDDFTPPQGYARTKIEPDKKAILAALEAGERMEGATLVLGLPIVTVR